MLAVDTNVLVRYLTGDHVEQFARAKALIVSEDLFVSTTVLLETEWVLRSVYGYRPVQLVPALRAFAGLPRITLEDPAGAAKALGWMANGMDFADALHLVSAKGCEAFISFDQRFAAAANAVSDVKVRAP
jgi:predicted nucleic-acid-binding protein